MMLWGNQPSLSPHQIRYLNLKRILRWHKWSRWEDRCSRCSKLTTDSPRLQLSNNNSKWWCSRWARWCKWCRLWWPMHLINNNSLNQHHKCSLHNSCNHSQINNSSSRFLRLPHRMILLPTYSTLWHQLSLLRITPLQAIPLIWIRTVDQVNHNLTILLTSEKKLWN